MNFQETIFDAAKDGDLHQLKEMLDGKSRKDAFSLVSARTNDSTPLIMACKNGHLDVARYLIESCNADINQVGSVTFGTDFLIERIEKALPLWCASAAGHLNIVEMLVKYNASVNSTSEAYNRTALYAACSYGQIEIAKFLIEHGADIEIEENDGQTCFMVACFEKHCEIVKYLLECGADINRKCDQGGTALHVCAHIGNLDIFKMLLKNGAKYFGDSDGITPALKAALHGHSEFVEYCILELSCTKQEQVSALELLGSFFIKKDDTENAFEYWKRAMELRYEDSEFPLEKHITRSIASCVDATEVRTLDQLEELVSLRHEMSIQALLTVERIIGLGHPDASSYIKLNSDIYIGDGNFDRWMKLWMYVLDEALKIRNERYRTCMIFFSLSDMASNFSFVMGDDSPFEGDLPPALFRVILHVFEICLITIETDICVPISENAHDYKIACHRVLITALRLVGFMCRLQPLNIDEDAELKKAVYKLVRLNPKGLNGSTLLHLACSDESSDYFDSSCLIEFPSTEVVDILLDVGACPNAMDSSNNTPLHVAAMNRPFAPAVFKALVNHGAHLDFRNNERKTPFQLTECILSFDVYPMHYINLKCLCAQAIRKHKIVYVGIVTNEVKEFLDYH